MALDSFIDKLPEDAREAYKAEIASAIIIKSREDADKYLSDHPHLKSARDAVISRTTENYSKKFKEEDLPKILEEERKKGQKQPWEIEMDKLKAERDADKKALAIEKQKARAYAKAQAEGIPAELVDRFIGETDEATDESLGKLLGVIKPWVESKENAIKAQVLGNTPPPKGGNSTGKTMSRAEFERLSPTEKSNVVRSGVSVSD